MCWQSGTPGTFLHAQLSREKKSSQFNTLEGIPHESKILIGVRFAFHGSVLSFDFDQAKNEIDQSHALLTFFSTNTFTKEHPASNCVRPSLSMNIKLVICVGLAVLCSVHITAALDSQKQKGTERSK